MPSLELFIDWLINIGYSFQVLVHRFQGMLHPFMFWNMLNKILDTSFQILRDLFNFWTSLFKFFWDTVFMFWYTCQDLLRSLSVLEQVHSNFRHLFQVLDNYFQVFVHFLTIRHSFQVLYFGHIFSGFTQNIIPCPKLSYTVL